MNESTKSGRDPLDQALASLPEDVTPGARPVAADPRGDRQDADRGARVGASHAVDVVSARAAVVLMLSTSFVTYYVTRQSMRTRSRRYRSRPCRPRK
jgi:hypothetical protein